MHLLKKLRTKHLVFSLALATLSSSSFAAFPAVPLATPVDQVNFLLAVFRAMPDVLSSRVVFDTPIEELIRNQAEIRSRVQSSKAWAALEPLFSDSLLRRPAIAAAGGSLVPRAVRVSFES